MDIDEMRRRVSEARVARLGTVTLDGDPHLVPVCFALLPGDVIVSGTDEKPKSTPHLRRLRNVVAHPVVTLLVDHYEEDWPRVWWVRLDGRGRVIDGGPEHDRAVEALRAKYAQYETVGIIGAVLAVDVERWRGWAYSEP